MSGGYEVELSDLRGWANQIDRASDDVQLARQYATTQIADADFGRILELMTDPYAGAIGDFHAVLQADAEGLGNTREGLTAVEQNYQGEEVAISGTFSDFYDTGPGSVQNDGEAAAFRDVYTPTAQLNTPGSQGAALPETPEVSFGFLLDKVCDLVVMVGGPDPRAEVTQWIAGDVEKAAMQVVAWQRVAECVDDVAGNLRSGNNAISATWTGDAADAATAYLRRWIGAFTEQTGAMRQMSQHLSDAIDEAVKMAQVVVDLIRTVVHLVSAALSNAAIPFYGQWKLIKTVKEAIQMVWSAYKAVRVFWSFLKMLVSMVQAVAASFSRTALPAAPAPVPS